VGRLLVTTATVVATLSWQLAWQGCASAAPSARFNVKKGDDDVFRGTAAWTVRATSGGREDVVAVPGVGEVIVGEGRCRLVRGGGALGAITVVPSVVPGACADVQGDRLCFNAVAFRDEGGDVVVDGCADRNEVFLERIDEEAPIGVGPAVFVERCAPLNAPALSYVRVSDIVVDGNNRARHGLRFRYSDGFEVCFLSRPEGRFTLTLEVEDPSPRQVVLSGDVDDL
jgi:hypothetical protein